MTSKAPCVEPTDPRHGLKIDRDFRHGRSVRFHCFSGYQRVGAAFITYNDSKWDGWVPLCKGKESQPFLSWTTIQNFIRQLREKTGYICYIKKIDLFAFLFFQLSDRGQVRENPSTPLKRAPKKLSKIVYFKKRFVEKQRRFCDSKSRNFTNDYIVVGEGHRLAPPLPPPLPPHQTNVCNFRNFAEIFARLRRITQLRQFILLILQRNSFYRAVPFANFEGVLGFSITSIILVKAGYANHNQGNVLDYPAWLRMTLDCLRMAKEIAMVSGFFVGGRRQTLLCSCCSCKGQE